MSGLISLMLSLALTMTGCGLDAAMSSIPEETKEKYFAYQSMAEDDPAGSSWVAPDPKGNVMEGFDPSRGDYYCGKEGCTGHYKTAPEVDGFEVCDNMDTPIEEYEPYYCSEVDCPGHEYGDQECDTSFTIDMTFVGDCMLATYMGQYYEGSFSWYAENKEPTYFFEKVYDEFSTDDFTIVNLENVLTDNNLKEVAKDHSPAYWYKAPTKNTKILTANSIEAVSLANNHYGDYGTQGRKDTVAAVEAAGLPYGTNDNIIYLEKEGFKIAVICHGLWGEWQADSIITKINEASEQSDYQIVYYHGGKERIHAPEQWKIRASRKLVDAGADLVIGNHPHVLQPMEEYNGVTIVYSLGNFCFGGSRKPENRTIMFKYELTIDEGKVISESSDIIPCYVYTGDTNNWQPAKIEDESTKQLVIDFMNGLRESPF